MRTWFKVVLSFYSLSTSVQPTLNALHRSQANCLLYLVSLFQHSRTLLTFKQICPNATLATLATLKPRLCALEFSIQKRDEQCKAYQHVPRRHNWATWQRIRERENRKDEPEMGCGRGGGGTDR